MVRWIWAVVVATAATGASWTANAQVPPARSVYFEGGRSLDAPDATSAVAAGFTFPFGRRHEWLGGVVTGYGDVFLSEWRARGPSGSSERRRYVQIGAIATWRYRFDGGTSAWFADAGIGVTVLDRHFATPERRFSTRFQFTEVLGIGRSFGQDRAHEVSLRLQHFSNGGIRKPNPGEDFLRLRYQYRF